MNIDSLSEKNIGIFGAGHLGRAIALRLMQAGVPSHRLSLCHSGSADTKHEVEKVGLAHLLSEPSEVVKRSDVLLYLVRPQHYTAISAYQCANDQLFVSFLAGVSLESLAANVPIERRVRVMTSAPDTLLHGPAIAALFPADSSQAQALLALLGAQLFSLRKESDVHAFTALGPCLPIALTYWESLNRVVDVDELFEVAMRAELAEHFGQLLKWARAVQPRGLSTERLATYVAQATTPGGVTEAILIAIKQGDSFADALWRGIQRSRELSMTN